MNYNLTLKTAPLIEPVTLAEIKQVLRLDIGDPTASLETKKSISPSIYTPATIIGTGVDILGNIVTVQLDVGVIQATGTLNVTIEESNDNITFTTYQAFAQVLPATDEQTYTIQYNGSQKYIRAIAIVSLVNASFGVNIILNKGYTDEDILLTSYIQAAREYCEDYQNRAYITQTWEMTMDNFNRHVIEIPKGNLQSINSVKYKNSIGVETILTNNIDYIYTTKGILGRLTPAYNKSWPSFVPFPLDAVTIEFTCGLTIANIPEKIKQAIKFLVGHWYSNRIPIDQTKNISTEIAFTLTALLWMDRIVNV